MNAKTVFRLLLVAVPLLGIASGLGALFPGNISEDWRTIREWDQDGGFYQHISSLALPSHVAGSVAVMAAVVLLSLSLLSVYVGMFLFWRFARIANLLLTVLLVLAAPWAGLVVLLPLEAGLYHLATLCEGAVVALSYTSPIKGYFEAKPTAGPRAVADPA